MRQQPASIISGADNHGIKMSCRNLVQKLIIEVLPAVAKDDTKHKNKFLLFILDDMVEYLGPDFLGPIYP